MFDKYTLYFIIQQSNYVSLFSYILQLLLIADVNWVGGKSRPAQLSSWRKGGSGAADGKSRPPMTSYRCQICQGTDHVAPQCPRRFADQSGGKGGDAGYATSLAINSMRVLRIHRKAKEDQSTP